MANTHKKPGHLITLVQSASIAEELDIKPGDYLLEVNGHTIEDVFDYRFEMQDDFITVLIQKTDIHEEWLLEIEKDYDEDIGIEFETGLMSAYKSCQNKCIFCFIDQMPKGMRESLYFKDDDSRLSFMQGNYITLTNMKEKDIDRIIRLHLSPVNISVHTTNPELRSKMLHNRFAGKVLKYMDKLYEHQIEMNGQIVLCKGINDGAELTRTINDLEKYLPCMRSISIVPVGLTKCREGLYPLELFTREDARRIIRFIEERQAYFYHKHGLHFVYASDEFYDIASLELPKADQYDGYPQWENGVGMVRSLIDEVTEELQVLQNNTATDKTLKRKLTIATGKMSLPTIVRLSRDISNVFPNINVQVVPIINHFFGETITITGLITGQDLIGQLQQRQQQNFDIGEVLLISSSMLRTGEQVFLDDLTTEDVSQRLGVKVCPVDSSGYDFVHAIVDTTYQMKRVNDQFVYINAKT